MAERKRRDPLAKRLRHLNRFFIKGIQINLPLNVNPKIGKETFGMLFPGYSHLNKCISDFWKIIC